MTFRDQVDDVIRIHGIGAILVALGSGGFFVITWLRNYTTNLHLPWYWHVTLLISGFLIAVGVILNLYEIIGWIRSLVQSRTGKFRLSDKQRMSLIHKLRPYSNYRISIGYIWPSSFDMVTDLGGVFATVGCREIKPEQPPQSFVQPWEYFYIACKDENVGRQIVSIFNSEGLKTQEIGADGGYEVTEDNEIGVLVGRLPGAF